MLKIDGNGGTVSPEIQISNRCTGDLGGVGCEFKHYFSVPVIGVVRRINTMTGFAELFLQFLPTDRGGRRSPISLSADAVAPYRPHLRVVDGDETLLGVEFVDGPDEPVSPGMKTHATVRFLYEPEICYDALNVGARFELLEGARPVAVGEVTRR